MRQARIGTGPVPAVGKEIKGSESAGACHFKDRAITAFAAISTRAIEIAVCAQRQACIRALPVKVGVRTINAIVITCSKRMEDGQNAIGRNFKNRAIIVGTATESRAI